MIDGRAILQGTVRLPGCFRECAAVSSYPNRPTSKNPVSGASDVGGISTCGPPHDLANKSFQVDRFRQH